MIGVFPAPMYQVIARKYRPQTFAELIGQEHVKTTLENAITQRRIAHGYIFSGQRGTGKTTVARIMARCLNCEQGPTANPCGKCASCLEIAAGSSMDVIEIDAASNRGINEMRELREAVRFRPARDRYKIFIIDEAHQITPEAFNALLKTLEEPPEWVAFLLCTTEAHKIPSTIASRCQQFSFRSVDFDELVARIEWIARQEAIACCGTTLDAGEIRELLGVFSLESLEQVATALAASDSRKMMEIVAELEANGRGLQHFSRELARYFRNLLVVKIAGGPTRLVAASANEQQRLLETAAKFSEEDLTRYLQLALDLFRDLQSSLQPRLHLEIGLLRMVHAGRLRPIEEALASLSPSGGAPARSAPAPAAPPPAAPPPAASPAPALSGDLRSRLHAALLEARQMHIADAVEHSEISESGQELIVTTPKMYVLYLKQPDFEAAARRVLGRPVRITVRAGEAAAAPLSSAPAGEDALRERALSHPEVRRFQEEFPGSQVRAVRNLRENEA